jgi:ketosteroid isomerase-like protein
MTSFHLLALLSLNFTFLAPVVQDDQEIIKKMLYDFLENVDQKATHGRFWSETLVYTSSSGARFGKAEIMSGFQSEEESESKTSFSAEEVNVRIIENTAILTFKLVAKTNGAELSKDEYYNSGTLTKENDEWKIVCWQATKIPNE